MKIFIILLLLYSFLKVLYYGLFELKEKENKSGGITIILFAILGLILPLVNLILLY